jgi:hypothetical protein
MRSVGGWRWLAVTGLLACGDSQAGTDYAGEPLMTLRGVVQATASLEEGDFVPGLRFLSIYDISEDHCNLDVEPCSDTVYYVKGDVEGEFPSAFTLRLFEPPDPEVIEEVVKGESPFARGPIVAVSRQHPKFLRTTRTQVEVDGQFPVYDKVCSDTGQCIQRDFWAECQSEDGYTFDAPYPCGGKFSDEYPWNIYGWSDRQDVYYFAKDLPAGSVLSKIFNGGRALSAGYHLVRYIDAELEEKLSPDEFGAYQDCLWRATVKATEDINRMFGTHYYAENHRLDGSFDSIREHFQAWDEANYRRLIDLGCTMNSEVVDTSVDPIELIFSDKPPFRATVW